MTSFQSSELTELPVVENSQLFAQRAHSARYAPLFPSQAPDHTTLCSSFMVPGDPKDKAERHALCKVAMSPVILLHHHQGHQGSPEAMHALCSRPQQPNDQNWGILDASKCPLWAPKRGLSEGNTSGVVCKKVHYSKLTDAYGEST